MSSPKRSAWAFRALFVLVAVLSSGCARYVRVLSTLQIEATRTSLPTITAAPSFRSRLAAFRTVAIQAPDRCIDQGQSATTGQTRAEAQLMSTQCGVELGELEQALMRAGFRVVSWSAMRSVRNSSGASVIDAARRLQAQLVFQVNSFEYVVGSLGADARWRRQYSEANESGSELRPALLNSEDRAVLTSLLEVPEQRLANRRRIGAALNINAVDAETGETVWFYQWALREPVRRTYQTSTLYQRVDRGWAEALTPGDQGEEVSDSNRSVDLDVVSMRDRGIDARRQVQYRLVRNIIQDCVARFAGTIADDAPPQYSEVLAPAPRE